MVSVPGLGASLPTSVMRTANERRERETTTGAAAAAVEGRVGHACASRVEARCSGRMETEVDERSVADSSMQSRAEKRSAMVSWSVAIQHQVNRMEELASQLTMGTRLPSTLPHPAAEQRSRDEPIEI